MQAPEGPEAPNADRDPAGHPGHDSAVQEDAPPLDRTDRDQPRRLLFPPPAPTEPQVTNVTAASAAAILVRDDEGIGARSLPQPAEGFAVEDDLEVTH